MIEKRRDKYQNLPSGCPDLDDFHANVKKKYLAISDKVKRYLQAKTFPPQEIEDEYYFVLSELRAYLDSINFKMPKVKYPTLLEKRKKDSKCDAVQKLQLSKLTRNKH